MEEQYITIYEGDISTEELQQELDKFEESDIVQPLSFLEQRERESFLSVDEICPSCNKPRLERQDIGFEREVFCTNCSYHRTEEL